MQSPSELSGATRGTDIIPGMKTTPVPARATDPRCQADAQKGTGTGVCARPVDMHGNCDRADSHA